MAIRCRTEKPRQKMEIDLSGPEGNAFVLMGYAQRWGRQLGYSEHKIKCIIDEMKLTTYEGLIHTFESRIWTICDHMEIGALVKYIYSTECTGIILQIGETMAKVKWNDEEIVEWMPFYALELLDV